MAFIYRLFNLFFLGSSEEQTTLFSPQRHLARPVDGRVAVRHPRSFLSDLKDGGEGLKDAGEALKQTGEDLKQTGEDLKQTGEDIKDGADRKVVKADGSKVLKDILGPGDDRSDDGGNHSSTRTSDAPPASTTHPTGPSGDPARNTGHDGNQNTGTSASSQPSSGVPVASPSNTGVVNAASASTSNSGAFETNHNVLAVGTGSSALSPTGGSVITSATVVITTDPTRGAYLYTSYTTYYAIPSSASSPSSPPNNARGRPPPALIGGVITGVILLLAIFIFLIRLVRKRRAIRASKGTTDYPFVGSAASASNSDFENSTSSPSPTPRPRRGLLSSIRNLFPSAHRSVFRYVPDPFLSASRRSSFNFMTIGRWSRASWRSNAVSFQTAPDQHDQHDDREKQDVSPTSTYHTTFDFERDPEKYSSFVAPSEI